MCVCGSSPGPFWGGVLVGRLICRALASGLLGADLEVTKMHGLCRENPICVDMCTCNVCVCVCLEVFRVVIKKFFFLLGVGVHSPWNIQGSFWESGWLTGFTGCCGGWVLLPAKREHWQKEQEEKDWLASGVLLIACGLV